MARNPDVSKRQAWRERLQRFSNGNQTVASFCRAERVSVPSFYQWRRKLGAPQRRAPAAPISRQAFVPVHLVSPDEPAAFVEIHLPNGARVCLTGADQAWLTTAVAAAAQAPCGANGDVVPREEAAPDEEVAPC